MEVWRLVSASGSHCCSGWAERMEDGAPAAHLMTTLDSQSSLGLQAGPGSGAGYRSEWGFGPDVQFPAVAPRELGCAEAGAGPSPC